jgi:SAM-dependent methyltransferase
MEVIPIVTSIGVLKIRQNISYAAWNERVPGLLWKQGFGMLHWFETMPSDAFEGKHVLEVGAGVGMLAVYLALRGALLTATDASFRALRKIRENGEANMPSTAYWNRLTVRHVEWGHVQSRENARLAGLAPRYDIIVASALLYAPTPRVKELTRLLCLMSDANTELLWGSGHVHKEDYDERWPLVASLFEVVDKIDAVAAGFTKVPGTLLRMQRRKDSLSLPCQIHSDSSQSTLLQGTETH